ncbi:MAG: hypothetical protein ACKOAS_09935 [Verrucomicrobiota bacterium]
MPTLTKLVAAMFSIAALAGVCQAQKPAETIDLSDFPAQSIDEVVVPVPSEVFIVLDKLGNPNWRGEQREFLGKQTANRAQVALLLGTVIAEGFVAVEAEDPERVKEIGRRVLALSKAINVEKAVLERAKSITDKAEVKDWQAVRKEFDGALQDVKGAMTELGDDELAQLVSVGGWIRGTEVLTSIVRKTYTADSAELLHQPVLLDYFSKRLSDLSNTRLANDRLVVLIRKSLKDIRPLIGDEDGSKIPLENVQRIHQLTRDLVGSITSQGA